MLIDLLLRVLLLLAGLVLGASIAVVAAAMFVLWGARAAWSMLTGRPVTPFIVRLRPFGAFDRMARRAPPQPAAASRTPRADAVSGRLAEVTDVEAKRPVR